MIACFLDLETTGFDRDHCDIIQVAGLIYNMETGEEIEGFDEFVKPRGPIPRAIIDLTGITNMDVINAKPIWEVLKEFWSWLEAHNVEVLIGHNIDTFDMSFLNNKSKAFNVAHKTYPTIDTIKMARKMKKERGWTAVNQPYLAQYFGIKYDAHNAFNDIRCLVQIYQKMINLTKN